MKQARLVFIFGAASVTMSCADATATCHPAAGIAGEWAYRAQRETPVPGTISGTFLVESQSCEDLYGVMDLVETATGESRRLAGPVSGTVLDPTLIRFEATFNGGGREHLARFTGDSLSGSWVETSVGASGSGSFTATRRSP